MANHELIFRPVDMDKFLLIKNGEKKVETRAGNPEYLSFKKEDTITFTCGKEKFSKTISRTNVFKSTAELLQKYDFKMIDPGAGSPQELENIILNFPNYPERIKKYGIIAFEFTD